MYILRLGLMHWFIQKNIEELGVKISYDIDEVLEWCDAINVLRIQKERMGVGIIVVYSLSLSMDGEVLLRGSQVGATVIVVVGALADKLYGALGVVYGPVSRRAGGRLRIDEGVDGVEAA